MDDFGPDAPAVRGSVGPAGLGVKIFFIISMAAEAAPTSGRWPAGPAGVRYTVPRAPRD